ncbi:hydroxymethylglutaryl-CoA lyase [Sediminibacterium ginsengisoli]|uniref:Hydroxymethylglutaryl-CoA lyase n=1 Tax=Sediminibacterium ginsengisoli TaxID=413434 RepID=A0A1T4L7Y4_9BACT|nr:hydroxymethylglutaryl-CoA lyase [Sediminibacterium ginsengisoli]SJZ50809.1 hydroxymethylglutaryl-CoA lyase [Sediminibacterium ginsengisoli]
MLNDQITLVECPRDAMQGWAHFIPTDQKIAYINTLLKVGFDTLDFGSFVSPKAIPQMADTKDVIAGLDLSGTKTKLLAIVANERGARDAVMYDEISYLGFPFSVSPTFQQRNTNSTMEESAATIDAIQELCVKTGKEAVIYLSMGFGNPYGDEYNQEILLRWAAEMVAKDIRILSLADTVGVATPEQVTFALQTLIPAYPGTSIGVHLHSAPHNWKEKAEAALNAGCRRFDGALKGIGGCPMAQDDLVGNMDSELMIPYFRSKGYLSNLDDQALSESSRLAASVFQ